MKKPKIEANTIPELLTEVGVSSEEEILPTPPLEAGAKDLIENLCWEELREADTAIIVWRDTDDTVKVATNELDKAVIIGILEEAKLKVFSGDIVPLNENIDLIDPDGEGE